MNVIMTKQGKYVYGIIKSIDNRKFDYTKIGAGIENNPIYSLTYKAITAIVSDAPIKYYEPDEEHAMVHRSVVDEIIKRCIILPASFGSVLRSVGDIMQIIRQQYGIWYDLLKKMDGKREYGLKIFWDKETIQKEIEETNKVAKELKEQLMKEEIPRLKIQLKLLLENELITMGNKYVEDIHEELKNYSIASKSNDLIGNKMIFNGAFLIKNEIEGEFNRKLEEIEKGHPNLEIKWIGPCAPYNFATVRLKFR